MCLLIVIILPFFIKKLFCGFLPKVFVPPSKAVITFIVLPLIFLIFREKIEILKKLGKNIIRKKKIIKRKEKIVITAFLHFRF